MMRQPRSSTLFPYTPLFRSRIVQVTSGGAAARLERGVQVRDERAYPQPLRLIAADQHAVGALVRDHLHGDAFGGGRPLVEGVHDAHDLRRRGILRSEEHTSELQSQSNLVCRLLLE